MARLIPHWELRTWTCSEIHLQTWPCFLSLPTASARSVYGCSSHMQEANETAGLSCAPKKGCPQACMAWSLGHHKYPPWRTDFLHSGWAARVLMPSPGHLAGSSVMAEGLFPQKADLSSNRHGSPHACPRLCALP